MRGRYAGRARCGALAALIVLSLAGAVSGQAPRAPAPAFTLQLLGGGALSLAQMKGSPVVLLFWAPW